MAFENFPRGGPRRDDENAEEDRQHAARDPSDSIERARYRRDLLREYRVRQCRTTLDEPYARPRHRLEHCVESRWRKQSPAVARSQPASAPAVNARQRPRTRCDIVFDPSSKCQARPRAGKEASKARGEGSNRFAVATSN